MIHFVELIKVLWLDEESKDKKLDQIEEKVSQ